MKFRYVWALVTLIVTGFATAGEVTVVFYNIQFLDAAKLSNQGNRRQRLTEVISELKADVFGLSEIKDRAAVEAIFPPTEWGMFIDDDSAGETQDSAIVFRKSTMKIIGVPDDLDADNEHFLFPHADSNSAFPGRRDGLFATLQESATGTQFVMIVVHLKARVGGRQTTQFRRVEAARHLASAIESRFDGKPLVIGGDWNDNPDDVALNVLETGDPNADFGPPKQSDPVFLINLMEPLIDAGHVSHGKKESDIDANGRIDTIDSNSRKRNKDAFGSNANTKAILFDQILVSDELNSFHMEGTTKVFDGGVALKDGAHAASDHLPVLTKFRFIGRTDSPAAATPAPASTLRIVGLLPDPAGEDAGHEEVHLRNSGSDAIDLQGWQLVDRATNSFRLSGTIAAGATLKVKLPAGQLPLNNSGDTVKLFHASGNLVQTVTYARHDVSSGILVTVN